MRDVECPYCGHEQDINHDDGCGYEESEIHEQECPGCNKIFCFTTAVIFDYEVRKADCLNGSSHKYEATITYPVKLTKMECTDCGTRRECTVEEMAKILKREK